MKYIGFYDVDSQKRNVSMAAVNKINYICTALGKAGFHTDLISCSMIANEKSKAQEILLDETTKLHFFKTAKRSSYKLFRIFQVTRMNLVLFFYLLRKTKRKEKILVYHSLGLMRAVYWAKKIKNFQMVLEVEEIYNDVGEKSEFSRKMEEKLIACADSYIFPTELLNQKLNIQNKPHCLIHGTYQVEKEYREKFEDDKIHVVYAGTIDPRKGGAAAATAGAFLSEKYHIHILGFGSETEKEFIQKTVEETNAKGKATVTYDGLLTGEEYIRFLQKCQIGLCPQDPQAAFNATSFPSKILSYMANGLRVVSVRIPAIEGSAVGSDIYYYDEQTPEKIAEAICRVDTNDDYNGREKIRILDKKFVCELKTMLEG